jgi:hypothetical protein
MKTPNAIKVSTKTLSTLHKELMTFGVPTPEATGIKIIIDDTMALNDYVFGFYVKGVFTAA